MEVEAEEGVPTPAAAATVNRGNLRIERIVGSQVAASGHDDHARGGLAMRVRASKPIR